MSKSGEYDPYVYPGHTDITNEDLIISKSDSSKYVSSSRNNNTNYFFNSWNHNKAFNVTATFIGVRHVTVKTNSWSKISDNIWHPIEGLKADRIKIMIVDNHTDKVNTKVIEGIVGLFIKGETVVGKILTYLNTLNTSSTAGQSQNKKAATGKNGSLTTSKSDSTAKAIGNKSNKTVDSTSVTGNSKKKDSTGNNLKPVNKDSATSETDSTSKIKSSDTSSTFNYNSAVTLEYKSQDTVIFIISDTTVFYAARFAKINEPKDLVVGLFKKKIASPLCSYDPNKDLSGKTIYPLMNDCSLNNYVDIKMNFVNSLQFPNTLFIIKTKKIPNPKGTITYYDTLYQSPAIDFDDEYSKKNYADSYPIQDTEFESSTGGLNRIVVCAYDFHFDPSKKKIDIVGYEDGYYHNCIYYQTAAVTLFPF